MARQIGFELGDALADVLALARLRAGLVPDRGEFLQPRLDALGLPLRIKAGHVRQAAALREASQRRHQRGEPVLRLLGFVAQLFLPGVTIQQAVQRRAPATHVAGAEGREAQGAPQRRPILSQRSLQRRPFGALRLKAGQRSFVARQIAG